MDNQPASGMSVGAKVAIGIVVVILIGIVIFSKSNKEVLAPVVDDTPSQTNPVGPINKGTDILASGKSMVCTSSVVPNVNNTVTYQISDGNVRVDSKTVAGESHVILTKSGTAYYWGMGIPGVLTGPQYATSARMLLEFPVNSYTCVEQAISASVFVPPVN